MSAKRDNERGEKIIKSAPVDHLLFELFHRSSGKRNFLIGWFASREKYLNTSDMMDKSLKAVWAKRLCDAGDSKWCAAFSSATTHLGGTFLFECNFDIHDLNLTSELPFFYKEILSAWQEIHSTDPSSADEYGIEIIWNNRFIRIDGKPIFFLSWYQKGVSD